MARVSPHFEYLLEESQHQGYRLNIAHLLEFITAGMAVASQITRVFGDSQGDRQNGIM